MSISPLQAEFTFLEQQADQAERKYAFTRTVKLLGGIEGNEGSVAAISALIPEHYFDIPALLQELDRVESKLCGFRSFLYESDAGLRGLKQIVKRMGSIAKTILLNGGKEVNPIYARCKEVLRGVSQSPSQSDLIELIEVLPLQKDTPYHRETQQLDFSEFQRICKDDELRQAAIRNINKLLKRRDDFEIIGPMGEKVCIPSAILLLYLKDIRDVSDECLLGLFKEYHIEILPHADNRSVPQIISLNGFWWNLLCESSTLLKHLTSKDSRFAKQEREGSVALKNADNLTFTKELFQELFEDMRSHYMGVKYRNSELDEIRRSIPAEQLPPARDMQKFCLLMNLADYFGLIPLQLYYSDRICGLLNRYNMELELEGGSENIPDPLQSESQAREYLTILDRLFEQLSASGCGNEDVEDSKRLIRSTLEASISNMLMLAKMLNGSQVDEQKCVVTFERLLEILESFNRGAGSGMLTKSLFVEMNQGDRLLSDLGKRFGSHLEKLKVEASYQPMSGYFLEGIETLQKLQSLTLVADDTILADVKNERRNSSEEKEIYGALLLLLRNQTMEELDIPAPMVFELCRIAKRNGDNEALTGLAKIHTLSFNYQSLCRLFRICETDSRYDHDVSSLCSVKKIKLHKLYCGSINRNVDKVAKEVVDLGATLRHFQILPVESLVFQYNESAEPLHFCSRPGFLEALRGFKDLRSIAVAELSGNYEGHHLKREVAELAKALPGIHVRSAWGYDAGPALITATHSAIMDVSGI